MNLEVAGSNPAVGFDRCGFSPNGFEGVLCLLIFFFIGKEKIEGLRIQEEQDAASAVEEIFAFLVKKKIVSSTRQNLT